MFRPIYWPVLFSLVFLDKSSKTRLYPTTSSTECMTSTRYQSYTMQWCADATSSSEFFLRSFLFLQIGRSINRSTTVPFFFLILIPICQSIARGLIHPSFHDCFLLSIGRFLFFNQPLPPFSITASSFFNWPLPPFSIGRCLLLRSATSSFSIGRLLFFDQPLCFF